MKRLCVIGSLNVDLTIRLPRFHLPGETITGQTFDSYPGGKGGNQAVAAACLEGDVLMVGKLGDDQQGAFYREVLRERGVDASGVKTVEGSSGVALIEVDASGENRICLVPGANALVDRAQIDTLLPSLLLRDIFLFQLEIPLDTVCYAAQRLFEAGKTVILDPAPAIPLPDGLLGCASYVAPNETELSLLTGMSTATDEEVVAAARCLLARGAGAVLAKLGPRGVIYVDREQVLSVPGFQVPVADTTAAGDTFCAAFAVALSKDLPLEQGLRIANAAAALSTTGAGAQQAMPTLAQVQALLMAQS